MANERFFRRGKEKWKWAASIADTTSPFTVTRAEIDGAVSLSVDVAGINGFKFNNSPIDTPDLATTFTTQIPGEDTAEGSSLDVYDRDQNNASNAIRSALTKGSTGYLLRLPYGDVPGRRMEIWHVQCTGQNDTIDLGNTSAQYTVGFAVLSPPTQDATVPA